MSTKCRSINRGLNKQNTKLSGMKDMEGMTAAGDGTSEELSAGLSKQQEGASLVGIWQNGIHSCRG